MAELWPLVATMLVTGIAAGLLAGLFGIGGGIVIVPVLESALGFIGVDPAIRMHCAVATSLATIVPTSVSSARAHHLRGAVDLDIVRRWSVFVLLGAVAGAVAASQMHSRTLALVFATLALAVALKMIFFPKTRNLTDRLPEGPGVAVIPAAIGGLSSMMGIGGGTFSVMTLSLFGVPVHRAVGTAALLGLFIALPGMLGYIVTGWDDPRLPRASLGYVNVIGFLLIAPVTWLVAPVGARIAHAFSERRLTVAFGVFLVIVAARLYYRTLF
jgi:uncharacterized membrane protein YfcA